MIVRHVPINEQEFSVHKFREKQLQPYDEEEETKAEEAAKKAMIGNYHIIIIFFTLTTFYILNKNTFFLCFHLCGYINLYF